MANQVVFIESGTGATQDTNILTSPSNGSGPSFTGVAGTGTITSDTQAVFGSVRSLKIATGASNGSAGVYIVGVMADAGRRVSFGFRFHGTPSPGLNGSSVQTVGAPICTVDNNGLQSVTYCVALTPNNQLILTDGLGVQVLSQGSTVLQPDTDYQISFSYVITNVTNNNKFVLYLNNAVELSSANANINGVTGTDTLGFDTGDTGWSAGSNFSYNIAHLYIDNGTSGDTGNVRVTDKLPISNGTTTGFGTQIGGGGSGNGSGHTPQVNERPASDTDGWSIIGAGSAVTEEYNIQGKAVGDADLTHATILDCMGWVRTKALAGETGSMIINGATFNISITTSIATFVQMAGSGIYPAGSGSDIGEITTTAVTTVSLYECGITVAYLSPTLLKPENMGRYLKVGSGMSRSELAS